MAQGEALRVVILGAGPIGVSFASAFADVGAVVTLVDPDAERRARAPEALERQRAAIALGGLHRGGAGRVAVVGAPGSSLGQAALVLECGPESLETKRTIFAGLLETAPGDCILATASSAIRMSEILPDPAHQARCLVAHPVNPPAVLRLVELVPAPGTAPATVDRARTIFAEAGFHAVVLGKEIEGFVMNRLQGAVLREAYRLVDEGVVDVDGVDTVMRMALGPRWALSGPFETADLNTPGGIEAHAARMGPAYARMGEARGERVDWHAALVARVAGERRALVTDADREARVAWRARAVARLVALRDRLWRDTDG